MTTLYYSHGKTLTVGVVETSMIAIKYCGKGCSSGTRKAGLKLLAATVEGVGEMHREATQVQVGALKCIERIFGKERHTLDATIKLGIADVLRAIAAVVPLESWVNGTLNVESVRGMCLMGVRDELPNNAAVRYAFARALGELVARIHTAGAQEEEERSRGMGASDERSGSGDAGKKQKPGIVAENVELSLTVPMAEALMAEDRQACIALSQAWVSFLTRFKIYREEMDGCFDAQQLVELAKGPLVAVRVASMTSNGGLLAERGGGPSVDFGLGASVCTGDRPFSQACATYILRCGVVEQMGEHGQQELLLSLSRALLTGFKDFTPSLVMAQLNIISHLISMLGEIGDERAEAVEQALGLCFCSESAAVRRYAGSALSALAIAESGRAAKLFASTLNALKNAADALFEASNGVADKGKAQNHGIPRWAGTAKFGREIDAIHGWALATACLVSATPSLPLGIPSHYLRVACQITAALIESPRCEHPGGRCVELEAGYIILGALCRHASGILTSVYQDSVLQMWLPMFSEGSLTLLGKISGARDEQALSAELWWRSESLHALGAYCQSFEPCMAEAERNALSDFLAAAFKAVADNATVLRPTEVVPRGGYTQLQGTAALFQIRLLRMMGAMPLQLWNDEELVSAVSGVCIEGLTGSAWGLPSVAGAQSFLSYILNLEEDMMRRVYSSKDIFERNLLRFSGASGGLERELWSLRAGASSGSNARNSASQTYPQQMSLPDGLFLARAQFLAHAIRSGDPERADVMVERLCGLPAIMQKKDKTGIKKVALGIAASCPLILATKSGSKYGSTKLSLESVTRMEGLAEELSGSSSQSLWAQATVSELHAGLSQAINDQQSNQLMSTLCVKSASTASLDQRATCVLAIGVMSRSIGGLGLASLLPQIVQTLIALGRASPSSISPFIADALSAVSTSSGPSFLPFVRETLDLIQEMLLDEEIYSRPGLLPSIGQLGNAMVACLGPDYILGSEAYDICRSIVSELRASDPCGVRLKEDILAGALQSVLYAQMLVLFVPKALTTAQHVKVLVDTLPSRQPYLRRAAADTLRHLAERETEKVLSQRIEGALLVALDGESDRGAAEQLRAAIKVLLMHGAPSKPCSWARLLGDVATGTSFSKVNENSGSVDMDIAPDGVGDEDCREDAMPTEANGGMMNGGTQTEVANFNGVHRRHTNSSSTAVSPRLRTRIFAADCLIMVPSLAITQDKVHGDAVLAASRPGEWLALSAESLVDIGFKLASGDADGLRSRGVKLLSETLGALGASRDPLDQDELLMVQYQAQYVSALRSSLSKGASPAVNAEGCALVALFLEKGMAASDKQLLERLLTLLCEPLSSWSSGSSDSTQNAYAEWVGAGARAALLESHALCATLGVKPQTLPLSSEGQGIPYDEIVSRAHGPFYTILVECWTGLLEDAVVLLQGDETILGQHTLRLYGRLGAAKAPTLASARKGIEKIIRGAWPTILDASTLIMSRDRTVSHGDSGRSRYLSLFDITACLINVAGVVQMVNPIASDASSKRGSATKTPSKHDSKGMLAVMRSFSRLTDVRYAKEGWLEHNMVKQAAEIAIGVMQESTSVEALELGAIVIQNVMECTAMKHGPGELESRLAWALECIHLASNASPACLETSLRTLRLVLSTLITHAAPVEETSYCLFHTVKCSFDLCGALSSPPSSPSLYSTSSAYPERTLSLAYAHVVDTARIVAPHPNLAAASSMDPSMPSVEDILTSTASEACRCILCDANSTTRPASSVEYLTKVILIVGGMVSAPCQAVCIETLDACLHMPELQKPVFRAIESWLDEQPEGQWAHQCGRTIFPNVARELYACSVPATDAAAAQYPEHTPDTVTSMVRICSSFCELTEFSDVYLRRGLPMIVRLASCAASNEVRSACVAAMLALARGPASSTFKTIIKGMPEKERVKLHEVLATGSQPAHARSSSAAKGLQALDLSRFSKTT
jgi:hypothetical protein